MKQFAGHVVGGAIGLYLAVAGYGLFGQELSFFFARSSARLAAAQPQKASLAAAEIDHDVLAASQREDDVTARLQLAKLIADKETAEAERLADVARVKADAEALILSSPLNAEGPCSLMQWAALQRPALIDRLPALIAACHALGGHDQELIVQRWQVVAAYWYDLPEETREIARDDMRRLLGDGHFRGWAAERLAYSVVMIAPDLEQFAREDITAVDNRLMTTFDAGLKQFGEQKRRQARALPAR